MAELSDRGHAQLMVLYQTVIQDIERIKQQQWRDFYYLLILEAGLVGFYRVVLHEIQPWLHSWFHAAPIILTIIGCSLIGTAQVALLQKRKLVDDGYTPLLESPLREILEGELGKSVKRHTYPILYASGLILACFFSIAVMNGLKI